MKAFDFHKPILVLAPHLVMPTRNGADILVERTARSLSTTCPSVTVLGATETLVYRNGDEPRSAPSGSGMRSQNVAAVRTLGLRSHYYRERFLTRQFRARAASVVNAGTWGGILCSYLTTAELASNAEAGVAVWTHNDEFQWFEDLVDSSGRPLATRVASQSLSYLRDNGAALAEGSTLIHVSEADAAGFAVHIGGHANVVSRVGTDTDVPIAPPLVPRSGAARLLFVGSLSVQMNADALENFQTTFAPALLEVLPDVEVTVAGSNPSARITSICDTEGWRLVPNPSDAELSDLYANATFSILPFAYATGSKLKLLASLAHGVPYLTTQSAAPEMALVVPPSIVSDDPAQWAEAVAATLDRGVSHDDRLALRNAAEPFSWGRLTAELVDELGDELAE